MKKTITFLFIVALVSVWWACVDDIDAKEGDTTSFVADVERCLREDTIKAMAVAFAMQESRMRPDAVSECGKYVGCLQISRICVDEANRVLGFKCYESGRDGDSYDDRYDKQGSYGIFRAIMEHHNPSLDIDRAIDLWNPCCGDYYRQSVREYYAWALGDQEFKNFFDYEKE